MFSSFFLPMDPDSIYKVIESGSNPDPQPCFFHLFFFILTKIPQNSWLYRVCGMEVMGMMNITGIPVTITPL
jgi:hypothetical protein